MSNRYQSLDALRALLAWTVVFVHAAYFLHIRNSFTQDCGRWAVAGFVILSGFVIGKLLLGKKESFGRYMFRRLMRLYPCFLVVLAWCTLLGPSPIPNMDAFLRGHYNQTLLEHLLLIHGATPHAWPHAEYGFNPAMWSISLEMQLYVAAVPLLILMNRFRWTIIPLLAASAACALWLPVADGFILARLVFFLLGMVVAIYETSRSFVCDMVRLLAWEFTGGKQIQWPRPLLLLGQWSYSTFLCHWPILSMTLAVTPDWWPTKLKAFVLVTFAAPMIILASFWLHVLIEKPGIEFGRKFRFKKPPGIGRNRSRMPQDAF